ncbi:MAG: PQQ-binding-like beta-propeller repeat protein [Candidatus Kapabacteria bacterium]|jgi:outer membrane protein assembly factor BamB|nr:PQQ-binding-like beta-propeller repeat protein [Candidatus Kapabacteria bacterium]
MKYPKILLLAIALLCQAFSCQHQTDIENDTDVLWKSPISPSLVYGVFPKFIYKNAVVSQGVKNRSLAIIAFDRNTGKELWAWSDFLDAHGIRTEGVHQYQNTLVWRYAGRVYGINLDNGKTIWKERVIHPPGWAGNDDISGVGERFLFHSGDKEYFSGTTISDGIKQFPLLSTPPRISHSSTKMFLNALPNLLENAALNDTIAVLPFGIPTGGQAIGFTLFNLTQGKEIYTSTLPGDTSGVFFLPPTIHEGKLYFPSGSYILAFDLFTGKLLWKERFPSLFSGSGIIYYDGMIIGNCEDTFMYALDAKTGKQLWATKTSGTSSRLFEMNGVIYFTGGGDGLLHAVDAKTGKHIWKKESPDESRFNGAWFFDSVTGADGKIYVSSYISLFCYKAAR